MAELLPCPICGNIVHITEITVRHYGNRADYEAKIECSCGLTFEKEWIVQFTPTNEGVLISNVDIETAWNTRTPPTADVVEIETLRSWLYSIAINNVECDIQMSLSEACKDIISRLDGLRNFARERASCD